MPKSYVSLAGFHQLVAEKGVTAGCVVLTTLPTVVRAIGKESDRLLQFTITSDRVDREQDSISAKGWEFDDYQRNPVVLWAHDHYIPPIGRSRSLSARGNTWKSLTEFTPEDMNPFGHMIYRMYAGGFLHAVSVGLQPKEFQAAHDRAHGMNYLRQSLLEYSAVPVPANPDAVIEARSKGINTAPLRDWAERALDESRMGPTSLSDGARRRLEVLRAVSSPKGRALIVELGELKMAGTKTETDPPATTVKRLERWDCGEAAHTHTTEAEATSCASFPTSVNEFIERGAPLAEFVKCGRMLSDDQQTRLRALVDELAPPAPPTTKEDSADDPGVFMTETSADAPDEEGLDLGNDFEDRLRAAVTSAVDKGMKKVTGRVD